MTANSNPIEILTFRHDLLEAIQRAYAKFIEGKSPVELFGTLLHQLLAITGSEAGHISELARPLGHHTDLTPFACSDIDWAALSKDIPSANFLNKNEGNTTHTPGRPIPYVKTYLELPIVHDHLPAGMICLINRPQGYPPALVEALQPLVSACAQLFEAIAKEGLRQSNAVTLKRSNSFQSALLANIPAGILVEAEDGTIYAVNQVYCDLFGKQELALMLEGESCANEFTVIQQQYLDPASLHEWRQHCLAEGVGVSGWEFKLDDMRVYQQGYVPIFIEDELGILHINHIWIFNDITPLHQAISAAREASRIKSQFLATMSHEIRTPMNGVIGMLHMLGKTNLNAKQKRFLETAAGSGELLLKVINDILDFSKLEVGKLEIEKIAFDLPTLLEDSVALLAKNAQEKNLELVCSLSPNLPRMVMGDPTRLRQILINLLGNAIKFTEVGDVVLYVAPQDDDRIMFGVRDTGIGISEELQHRLFQAFSQMDSSHTRKYGGTGLGLAISQQLVRAMGGEIRVASARGFGSDFSFDIPLQLPDSAQPASRNIPNLLSNKRVLIVGNYQVSRQVIRQTLQSWNMHQLTETTSDEALHELEFAHDNNDAYDLLLLDLQIEDQYAHELAKTIRARFDKNALKLVVISGGERMTLASQADACLSKPMRRSELFNTLQDLFGVNNAEFQPRILDNDNCEWDFAGKRILVVDDNIINQDVAREILEDAGFVVDIRDNGVSAIQAVQEASYDAVLMDVQMPIMDGMQATRKIRALKGKYIALPIFAMTANALNEDVIKSLEAGMNGHLSKPFKPAAVFRILAEFLKCKVKAATTPATPAQEIPPDNLPGLDLREGLERVRGNFVLYRRILGNFLQQHGHSSERLETLIMQRQWSEACALAHSLKGTGGNLGALTLYSAAAATEQACKSQDTVLAITTLAPLQNALAEVLNSIAGLGSPDEGETAATDSPEASGESLTDVIHSMLALIECDLGEAQNCLARLHQKADTDALRAWVHDIEFAMNCFDTDKVAALLRAGLPPN